ncbi:hypothetical protein [Actinoplanes philippinensis]|uniref:hypothetical protein n=1 Tax=Actinoplanes philippinensis TaxID=35752 RepID=UPI0033D29039
MFTARVSPPRWAVVGGGLAGTTGAGLLVGFLVARWTAAFVDFAPLLGTAVGALITFGLSFWVAPRLSRLAGPARSRRRVRGR